MRRLYIFIVLLILAVSVSGQTVEQKYDRFKDQTSVIMTFADTGNAGDSSLSWTLAALFSGDTITQNPQSIALMVFSSSKDWRLLRVDLTLRAIVEQERIVLGKMKRIDSSIGRGYVTESALMLISKDNLKKLSEAKSAEVQFAGIEQSFSAQELANIKVFMEAITVK